jgi:hypothetical protein
MQPVFMQPVFMQPGVVQPVFVLCPEARPRPTARRVAGPDARQRPGGAP